MDVERVKCPFEGCNKTYKDINSRKGHLLTHGDKLFQCPTCLKQFYHKNSLIEHCRSHEGKQYSCPDCPKQFKTRSGLSFHTETHRERTFQCSICHKLLQSASRLAHHEKYHRGELPATTYYLFETGMSYTNDEWRVKISRMEEDDHEREVDNDPDDRSKSQDSFL
jgi:uncharacterized Zn-finger protein